MLFHEVRCAQERRGAEQVGLKSFAFWNTARGRNAYENREVGGCSRACSCSPLPSGSGKASPLVKSLELEPYALTMIHANH